jgi:hypothetical protein
MVLRLARLVVLLLLTARVASAQTTAPVASGSLTTTTCPGSGCVTLNVSTYGAAAIQLAGTWTGTVTFYSSVDGTNYQTLSMTNASGSSSTTSTSNNVFTASVGGFKYIRAKFTTASSGTVSATIQASLAGGGSGGGGGGTSSTVTINDPSVTSQKAAVNASGQLSVTCANCSGSGASAVDQAAFTVGAGSGAPSMGLYEVTPTTLTDGTAGLFGATASRQLKIDLSGSASNTNAFKVNVASGGIASGAIASGAIASGAVASGAFASGAVGSGAIASGAVASGAVASGAFSAGSISDGADVTIGAKADAKSTATDTTAVTIMSVLKEISFMEQTPASRAVTNAGTFAVQLTGATNNINNIAGTVSLPTGASTSSLQGVTDADDASIATGQTAAVSLALNMAYDGSVWRRLTFGTAGTASAQVLTVQGIASMTPLLVTLSGSNSLAANQSVNVAQQNGAALASPDANSYAIVTRAATATSAAAATACNILSGASTNSTSCKGSAGNVYGFDVYNTTTTVYYLRLYNTASAPTCSSATGFIRSVPIPPAASAGLVGGIVSNQIDGVNYGTGIGYCITGGSSSTDNTNAATGVFGEIRVK